MQYTRASCAILQAVDYRQAIERVLRAYPLCLYVRVTAIFKESSRVA